jgi:hypothetical protein
MSNNQADIRSLGKLSGSPKEGTAKNVLFVEGETDKKIIAAFLDAHQKKGDKPLDWRTHIDVKATNGSKQVLQNLRDSQFASRAYGLIDRDGRTDSEIAELQAELSRLLVLPRWTIENYFIDPDELEQMLPEALRGKTTLSVIQNSVLDWVRHGALWRLLYERGAFEFCRGHEDGFPMALFNQMPLDEARIRQRLMKWQENLDAETVMASHEERFQAFQRESAAHYTRHIHGKRFFNDVVLRVLNTLKQKNEKTWLDDLISGITTCPPDLVPVLQRLFT